MHLVINTLANAMHLWKAVTLQSVWNYYRSFYSNYIQIKSFNFFFNSTVQCLHSLPERDLKNKF